MITMSLNVLLLRNRDLCFPQNCFYVCVGNVPRVSMCLENGLLSFSGPCVHDIDFWQLSKAITPPESQKKNYPDCFPKIPNTLPFLDTSPPFPTFSFAQPVIITFVTLLRQVQHCGLPVVLRRVSDLWPDKLNLKLPPGEVAGSATATEFHCLVYFLFLCVYIYGPHKRKIDATCS